MAERPHRAETASTWDRHVDSAQRRCVRHTTVDAITAFDVGEGRDPEIYWARTSARPRDPRVGKPRDIAGEIVRLRAMPLRPAVSTFWVRIGS